MWINNYLKIRYLRLFKIFKLSNIVETVTMEIVSSKNIQNLRVANCFINVMIYSTFCLPNSLFLRADRNYGAERNLNERSGTFWIRCMYPIIYFVIVLRELISDIEILRKFNKLRKLFFFRIESAFSLKSTSPSPTVRGVVNII